MRQFFLETDPDHLPRPGDIVSLDQAESHHLFTVLRGGRDPHLDLVDGRGLRLTGQPEGKNGRRAKVQILTATQDSEETREPRLVLACAVIKGRRFEWALEKAVELGAHEFWPLVTDLTVVDPRSGKQDRWRSLMVAALKQSRRSWLPVLSEPLTVSQVLDRCQGSGAFYGATSDDAPGDDPLTGIAAVLAQEVSRPKPEALTMLIGPEGGWSPTELSLLIRQGARPVTLGPHVLRTETAAVLGLAFLQALRGQWSG